MKQKRQLDSVLKNKSLTQTLFFSFKDVNECAAEPCAEFAKCDNFEGSFTCTCQDGFHGNGYERCLSKLFCSKIFLIKLNIYIVTHNQYYIIYIFIYKHKNYTRFILKRGTSSTGFVKIDS